MGKLRIPEAHLDWQARGGGVFPAEPPGVLGGSPWPRLGQLQKADPHLCRPHPPWVPCPHPGWEGVRVFMERLNPSAVPKEAESSASLISSPWKPFPWPWAALGGP